MQKLQMERTKVRVTHLILAGNYCLIAQITKDRRPVDPPPILKLEVATDQDPDGVYKQSRLAYSLGKFV